MSKTSASDMSVSDGARAVIAEMELVDPDDEPCQPTTITVLDDGRRGR